MHITSEMMRELWGDVEIAAAKVIELECLGHIVQMPDHCIPQLAQLAGYYSLNLLQEVGDLIQQLRAEEDRIDKK